MRHLTKAEASQMKNEGAEPWQTERVWCILELEDAASGFLEFKLYHFGQLIKTYRSNPETAEHNVADLTVEAERPTWELHVGNTAVRFSLGHPGITKIRSEYYGDVRHPTSVSITHQMKE